MKNHFEHPNNTPEEKKEVAVIKTEQEPIDSFEKKARKISQSGDYEQIKEGLGNNPVLETNETLLTHEIGRVKKKFETFREIKDFPTQQKRDKMWEMLTIIELFDEKTAEHCNETYLIAKEKIEKVLTRDIKLADLIEEEGIDLESYYIACRIHDVGKTKIPEFVLNDTTTEEQFNSKLDKMIENEELPDEVLEKMGLDPKESPYSEKIIRQKMKEKHLLPKDVIPMQALFQPEEKDENIKELENRGFSPNNSLTTILGSHEQESKRIINDAGMPIVAKIAGQHHNRTNEEIEKPITIESLQLSNNLATIIKLADVEQALQKERSYKEAFTPLKVLATLMNETEKGPVSKVITCLWMKDELAKIEKKAFETLNPQEQKQLEDITSFIDEVEHSEEFESWLSSRHKKLAA